MHPSRVVSSPASMSGTSASISVRIVAKIVTAAVAEGIDRDELLARAEIDSDQLAQPNAAIATPPYYALWDAIMRGLPDREHACGFPIRYARTIRTDDYGALGLAQKTAPDLRSAIERAVRYSVVLTDSSTLALTTAGDVSQFVFQRDHDQRLGVRCANEAALGEAIIVAREITGINVRPRRVYFHHEAPSAIAEHNAIFGAVLEFGAERNAIEFDSAALDLPVIKADAGMSRFFLDYLDKMLAERPPEPALVQELARVIGDELPGGLPKMSAVAKRMGMSARTLHRRLAKQGTSFQTLVEDTRKVLAKQLLRTTPHPLAEVAFLLGFSEQSAFQRAFKRWTGATPRAFRAAGSAGQ